MSPSSPQELEALVEENRRLKEEVSRLAKSMEDSSLNPPKLFRPPWQALPQNSSEVPEVSDEPEMEDPELSPTTEDLATAEEQELEDVEPSMVLQPEVEVTSKLPPLKVPKSNRRPSWRPPPNAARGWQQAPTLMGGSFAMGYPLALGRHAEGSVSLPALQSRRGKQDLKGRGADEEEYADRILEDVRQVLVSKTGSLQAAYDLLDMRKTGWADERMLHMAFDDLHRQGSGDSTTELPTIDDIFDALGEKKGGMVWLQELLDFTPRDKKKEKRMKDTKALWQDYDDKTAASSKKLDRQPRWRHEMKGSASEPTQLPPLGKDWDYLVSSKQRRVEIKKQFREDRQGITADQKRALVGGLVTPDEYTNHLDKEHGKLEGNRQRIRAAIKDCSKSRFELVEMQRKMAGLVDASEKKSEARALRSMLKGQAKTGLESTQLPQFEHLLPHGKTQLPASPVGLPKTQLPVSPVGSPPQRRARSTRSLTRNVAFKISEQFAGDA